MRIAGLDETRKLADERYPAIAEKSRRQFLAYREAADEDLFKVEKVAVHYTDFDRRVDLTQIVITARHSKRCAGYLNFLVRSS